MIKDPTQELAEIEKSFPNLTWTYASNGESRIYTGKVRDIIVVTFFEPSSQFVIHSMARDIITRYLSSAEAEVNFLLHNDAMLSIVQFHDALGKVFEHAEHFVKRYYIEQKQEQSYGERHY